MAIDASVIVCTYNRRDLTKQCIHALLAQDYQADRFEIVVLDNNSTDGTEAMVKEIIDRRPPVEIRYVRVLEQGLSYARNRGIDEARGGMLLFIDDDGIAEPDWVAKMAEAFANPAIAAVGGSVRLRLILPRPRWLTPRFDGWLSRFIPAKERLYPLCGPPWPVGCNMGFRAEVFERVGKFDPDLGRKGTVLNGGEETDLFLRILSVGMNMAIQPEALVHHLVASDRLRKDYFVRLNVRFGISRVQAYRSASLGKRATAFLRYTVETLINGIVYGLGLIALPFGRGHFLRYLFLRRSFAKLHGLLRLGGE